MFQDEARFGRIREPRRCWAPKGFRPYVAAEIVYEYTYVFAAISPADGVLDSLVLPVTNTEVMSVFLNEISARHAEEYILMFIDGAGWHRSKELMVPANIRLVQLPPYSPELNPTEHLWEEIREKWFSNKLFDSMFAVEDLLCEALLNLENDHTRVQSLTGFDWIISCLKIAT
jgi:transposase